MFIGGQKDPAWIFLSQNDYREHALWG